MRVKDNFAPVRDIFMKKQGFLQCSAILIASVIISKFIGALFKIPLTNLIGGVGMGYFAGAYGLFLPIYAVFVTGLSSASARMTAECAVLYGSDGGKKVKKYSLFGFSVAGVVGTVLILLLARPFSVYVLENEDVYLSVLIIAPSVFFSCITAAYRGCREGMQNMYPTAISQITEGIFKLAGGLLLCMYVLRKKEYFLYMFSGICDDINAIAAAAAIAGVTLSSFAGMVYMIIDDVFSKKPQYNEGYLDKKSMTDGKKILVSLIKIAIPVALSSLLTNLTSMVDLATIMRYVNKSVEKFPDYYMERYSFIKEIGTENFAAFVYGSFNGMAITIFNLVPSITNMFGKGVLPSITDAWVKKDMNQLEKNAVSALKITSSVAVPAGLGICITAKEILTFLFPSSCDEVVLASESLIFLAPAVIFLSLSFPLFCMFQAIGKENYPVKIMICGVIVKLAGNIILVRIPQLNASGAALSTLLCYAVIFIVSYSGFKKYSGLRMDFISTFGVPFYAGILCMASAWVGKCTVARFADNNVVILMTAVISGAVIYIFSIWVMSGKKLCSFIN